MRRRTHLPTAGRDRVGDGRRGGSAARAALERRLRPVYVAAFLQNVALWVPIEKLFMTDIGFDNGSVAVMAAAYAAVVPLLEVPSGILADRWSRRGVVLLAQAALIVSVVVGGLSPNVGTYIVAALFLGVFFAMQSGTFESIAYDTVLEETGDSAMFERTIGRIRFVESVGLVVSALAGGLLAEVLPLRATYFITVPFIVVAGVALLGFREPRLHRDEDAEPLRQQVAATYRALLDRGAVRPIVALLVLTALLLQAMLEFGPLWLVALGVSAGLYGPQWAGLMAALGVGGLLGGRLALNRPITAAALGAVIGACCIALVDEPRDRDRGRRAGRARAGARGREHPRHRATARRHPVDDPRRRRLGRRDPDLADIPAVCVRVRGRERPIRCRRRRLAARARCRVRGHPSGRDGPRFLARAPAGVPLEPAFAADQFRPGDDPQWPGHRVDPPGPWEQLRGPIDTAAVDEVRETITDLPSPQHDVIVARDVQGLAPADVRDELDLSPSEERDLLNQARGRLRAELDTHLKERGA